MARTTSMPRKSLLAYQRIFGNSTTGTIPTGIIKRMNLSATSVLTTDTTVPTVSIDTKSLKIAHPGTNQGATYHLDESMIGAVDIVLQADLRVSAIGSDVSTGKLGIIARASNNGFYEAYLRPQTNIIRISKVNGTGISETVVTASSAIAPTLAANTWYTLRFSLSGTALKAKVWVTGTTEPSAWNIDTTDATYSVGKGVGIMSFNSPDTWDGYITNFKSIDTVSRTAI